MKEETNRSIVSPVRAWIVLFVGILLLLYSIVTVFRFGIGGLLGIFVVIGAVVLVYSSAKRLRAIKQGTALPSTPLLGNTPFWRGLQYAIGFSFVVAAVPALAGVFNIWGSSITEFNRYDAGGNAKNILQYVECYGIGLFGPCRVGWIVVSSVICLIFALRCYFFARRYFDKTSEQRTFTISGVMAFFGAFFFIPLLAGIVESIAVIFRFGP